MLKYIIFLCFLSIFLCCSDNLILTTSNFKCINEKGLKNCVGKNELVIEINRLNSISCLNLIYDNKIIGELQLFIEDVFYVPFCSFEYWTTSYKINTFQSHQKINYGSVCGESENVYPPTCQVINNDGINNKKSVGSVCYFDCLNNEGTRKITSCYGQLNNPPNNNFFSENKPWYNGLGDRGCFKPIIYDKGSFPSYEKIFYSRFYSWSIEPSQENLFKVYKCFNYGNFIIDLNIKYVDLDSSIIKNNLGIDKIFNFKRYKLNINSTTLKDSKIFNIDIKNMFLSVSKPIFLPNEKILLNEKYKWKNYFVSNGEDRNNFRSSNYIGDLQYFNLNNENDYSCIFKNNDNLVFIQNEKNYYFNNCGTRLNKIIIGVEKNNLFPLNSNEAVIFNLLDSAINQLLNNKTNDLIFTQNTDKFCLKDDYTIYRGSPINTKLINDQLLNVKLVLELPNDFTFSVNINKVCPKILSCDVPYGCYDCLSGSTMKIKIKSLCDSGNIRFSIDETKNVSFHSVINDNFYLTNNESILNVSFFINNPSTEYIEIKLNVVSESENVFCNVSFKPFAPNNKDYNEKNTDKKDYSPTEIDNNITPEKKCNSPFGCWDTSIIKDIGTFFNWLGNGISSFFNSGSWESILITIIIVVVIVGIIILLSCINNLVPKK